MILHFIRYGSFSHDLHRGRNQDGKAAEVCALCGFTRLILAEPVKVDGPAHQPARVHGEPKTITHRPERKPVIGWRRSER